MPLSLLIAITVMLLLMLAGALAYLVMLRIRRKKSGTDRHLTKLSDDLLRRLDSQDITDEQKARIARALRQLQKKR